MPDVLRPPPEILKTFPKPNYVNPETHGPGLMIIASMLPVIGIIVVGLRLYARFYITRAPGWDDFCVVLAVIFGIALSVLIMLGDQIYYNGYHVWDIPRSSAVPHRINVWVAQIVYTLALSAVKIGILLFYKRLSVAWSRKFVIAVWIGIVYNILYGIGFVMLLCLLYRPLQAYWLSFDPVYYAAGNFEQGSEQIAEPLSAYFSVVGDFYSAVLPLIMVSSLTLPVRQKAALYALFSLGFAVVIFGSVRAYYMFNVVNVDWDFTWTLWKIWVWGEWELWFAIYASSAPALKPFFGKFFDKWSSKQSASRKVYVVRSDIKGNLGKVERHWVNKNRHSLPENGPYSPIASDRAAKEKGHTVSAGSSGIMKSVEYDVEQCSPVADWDLPLQPRSGHAMVLGPINRISEGR